MEPRREEQKPMERPPGESHEQPRVKRFQLIKLEARIAPGGGKTTNGHTCVCGVSGDVGSGYSIE